MILTCNSAVASLMLSRFFSVTPSMLPQDDSDKLFSITKVKPATHTLTSDLYTELKIVCVASGFIQPPSVCIYNWTQSSKWLVTKYQISAINSCWEKCNEKCAYMFNVYKNQQSRQTGSRNLTGPKTLPTIWYTYMTLVAKYQISAINSYCEKCFSLHFSQQLLMAEIWYLVTSFI
jgi:hypothetical protein